METEIGKDVLEALEKLGKAVQPYAEKGWEVFIKQVYIDGYLMLSGGAILILLSIISVFIFYKNEELRSSPIWVFTILFAIVGFVLGADGIRQVLNPEYFAIKDILGQ